MLITAAADEERLAAALESEADSILIDLEDGTPADQKTEARERVMHWLNNGVEAWVRINKFGTEEWHKDVEELPKAKGLRGVMLAEVEDAAMVTRTAMMLPPGTPIIALIESAIGIVNAVDIARAPGVFRLAFGIGDFRKDTGMAADALSLAYVRSQLVLASRVGELPGPIDGPSVGKHSVDLMKDCSITSAAGMTGKLTLDPAQVDTINISLAPSEDEIQWARDLLQKQDGDAMPKDGSYLPRLARAKKVSQLAKTYGLWRS
jgi:citrate lyase subunit beta/citryl-CoA lyase